MTVYLAAQVQLSAPVLASALFHKPQKQLLKAYFPEMYLGNAHMKYYKFG